MNLEKLKKKINEAFTEYETVNSKPSEILDPPGNTMVLVAVFCIPCETIAVSYHSGHLRWCNCGQVGVYGGPGHPQLLGNPSDYINLSVMIKDGKAELYTQFAARFAKEGGLR